jgi:AcrR family transcriptional regulator
MPAVMVNRLPPGRHGLSRDEVTGSQRERMLRGMAEAVTERGYANVTVADVIKRAGVSRETFYEQFANKEDCFMAAYDTIVVVLLKALKEAISPPPGTDAGGLRELIDRIVSRYLDELSETTLAWAFLIEINAAGPAAVKRRAEAQARGMEAVAAAVGARDERQRFASDALFVTIVGMATHRVAAGEAESLAELREPLVELAHSTLLMVGVE